MNDAEMINKAVSEGNLYLNSKIYPPLLTGGVLQPYKSLVSAGCDWATVSIAGAFAERLTHSDRSRVKQGRANHNGFKRHECREILGGGCFRHWEPYTASKKWSRHYETWRFTGQDGLLAGGFLRGAGFDTELSTSSRLDCAFDFYTKPSVTPEAFREACADRWRDELGLLPGVSGEGDADSHTVYIGGKTSERRIRIYRKDIESPWVYPWPTMRVEIILKGSPCAGAYWQMMHKDDDAFVRRCAGHVEDILGVKVLEDSGEIPVRAPKPRVELARCLAALVDQWGDVLAVADDLGVDMGKLVERRIKRSSRMAVSRRKKRREEGLRVGVEAIEQQALDIIGA